MREIFDSSDASLYSAPLMFEKSRHDTEESTSDQARDNAEIRAAKKLSDGAAAMTRSVMEVPEPCQPPHTLLVSLTGFDDPEIEYIMTLCGPGKSERWQWVHWTWESAAIQVTAARAAQTMCDKLRSWRKYKRRLCVTLMQDGTLSDGPGTQEGFFATKPKMTLDQALNPDQSGRDSQSMLPELLKKDRLELAVRITRSLLFLLWSPLLQEPWKPEAIYVSPSARPSQNGTTSLDLYVSVDVVKDSWPDESSRTMAAKCFVLYLGAMLWELLFVRKVTVTPEDEADEDEEPDEAESLSLYNALNREHCSSRNSFVDPSCLGVISSCLDIYVDGESDHAKFRSQVYYRIVKPLKEYFKLYYSSAINQDALKSRGETAKPRLLSSQNAENLAWQLAVRLREPLPVVEQITARPPFAAPPVRLGSLGQPHTAALLTSRGNVRLPTKRR